LRKNQKVRVPEYTFPLLPLSLVHFGFCTNLVGFRFSSLNKLVERTDSVRGISQPCQAGCLPVPLYSPREANFCRTESASSMDVSPRFESYAIQAALAYLVVNSAHALSSSRSRKYDRTRVPGETTSRLFTTSRLVKFKVSP
jgi:hypothetical protein